MTYETGYQHGRRDERTIARRRGYFHWLGKGVIMGMGMCAAWYVAEYLFHLGGSIVCP